MSESNKILRELYIIFNKSVLCSSVSIKNVSLIEFRYFYYYYKRIRRVCRRSNSFAGNKGRYYRIQKAKTSPNASYFVAAIQYILFLC